jgi:endonuclease-3
VRIQAILRAISETPAPGLDSVADPRSRSAADGSSREVRASELSLAWLPNVALADARDYLVALPGVGRKTAACVLLFAYGLRDVPVDTHVSRVGARLHLLQDGAPFERMHDQMLALTPPGQELELHVNLLRHGRRTCHARSPECDRCALARMCPSRALFI